MNSLKPLLIVAILAGIGYGVYVRINSGTPAPPPGVADVWGTPKVQLPDEPSSGGKAPWTGAATGGGIAPSVTSRSAPPGGGGGEAPPFQSSAQPFQPSAPPISPPIEAGGNAPPFNGAPAAPPIEQGDPAADPNAPQAAPAPPDQAPPFQEGSPPDRYNAPPDRYAPPSGASPADAPPANTAPPAAPGPPAGAAPTPNAPGGFSAVLEGVRRELEAGQMKSALRTLSAWYDDPQLTPPEQQQLRQLLDQVAGTVIYSTQNLLEAPYEVQPGERLETIAERHEVPWQLLAKINGIENPQDLRPGERLKVVRGPFTAVVSLEKREMTLLLSDGSYAGRFPIAVGRDAPPPEGVYTVADKVMNPVYRGAEKPIDGRDANNPLGERWIGLGGNLGIHGTNRPENIGRNDVPGSISLNPRDVEDVFDILTVGSKVTVRR